MTRPLGHHCANCHNPAEPLRWICDHCDQTRWPEGARFVIRRRWVTSYDHGRESGNYAAFVVDRAYNHKAVARSTGHTKGVTAPDMWAVARRLNQLERNGGLRAAS